MKTTLNFTQFKNWFIENRPFNFTLPALISLYDYILMVEEETGKEMEFDPIALCCEYTEYYDFNEFKQDYTDDHFTNIESIMDYTDVIPVKYDDQHNITTFIIANF